MKDQWCNLIHITELANCGKRTKRSQHFSDKQTKFENSSVNTLAGNPCVNKVKSPPRCGFVRMWFSFESIWGFTLKGWHCLMLCLHLKKKCLKCCFDGTVSLKVVPSFNWSIPWKSWVHCPSLVTLIGRLDTSNYSLHTQLLTNPVIQFKLNSRSFAPSLQCMLLLTTKYALHYNTIIK